MRSIGVPDLGRSRSRRRRGGPRKLWHEHLKRPASRPGPGLGSTRRFGDRTLWLRWQFEHVRRREDPDEHRRTDFYLWEDRRDG